jgi:hypothetical protein
VPTNFLVLVQRKLVSSFLALSVASPPSPCTHRIQYRFKDSGKILVEEYNRKQYIQDNIKNKQRLRIPCFLSCPSTEEAGIPVPSTKRGEPPFSMDANLLHISYEGNALEDPWQEPDESMFTRSVSPEQVRGG